VEDCAVNQPKRTKVARPLRLFEYTDSDGNVFWSFSQLPGYSVHRLTLEEHRGTHYRDFISEIHRLAFEAESLLKGDE